MLIQIELQNLAQTSASKSWPSCSLDRTFFLQNLAQYLVSKYRPNFIFKMLTKIQLQNLDQTSANIAILQIWSKQNKRITSRVLWNMRAHVFLHARARACYTCKHVLPTRASTYFLHVRARYLFVRARLLFKNVRPGQLNKWHCPSVGQSQLTIKPREHQRVNNCNDCKSYNATMTPETAI